MRLDREERNQMAKRKLGLTKLWIDSKRQMGYLVEEAVPLYERAKELIDKWEYDEGLKWISRTLATLDDAEEDPDFPYVEPSTLDDIKSCLPGDGLKLSKEYDLEDYYDKAYGGWLGKIIGGALGGPVEGWPRERILATYGEIWDYVEEPSTLNDDTAYEIIAIHALEEYGINLTSEILAWEWVEHLAEYYTAEEVAFENLCKGIMPPASGIIDNPFSEWIGAQMKGEVWGLLTPGCSELAMEYSYMDGVIAHEKNGVYGEIYDAVIISAAFVEKDPRRLLEIGLSYVPEDCRFAEVVKTTMDWCDKHSNWEDAWAEVEKTYAKEYSPVHTFPAIAAVVIGLLYGQGDFEKSLCITNMCGLDTDCTAGQTGAIMGTIIGAEAIPNKWKDPIGDAFESRVIGFERLRTSEIAKRTCESGRKILKLM